MKKNAAEKAGMKVQVHHLPTDTSQQEILSIIKHMNKDKEVHGIIVQLPLPPQFNKSKIIEAVNPLKDIDGITKVNMGTYELTWFQLIFN